MTHAQRIARFRIRREKIRQLRDEAKWSFGRIGRRYRISAQRAAQIYADAVRKAPNQPMAEMKIE